MKRLTLILAACATLSACAAAPLEEYTPITDMGSPAAPRFASDLQSCRATATAAEAAYKERQNAEMGANILAGLILGAAVGAAVGNSDTASYGAGYGALSGAAATDTELAHGGPRRIIDRCMAARGHTVLNDIGRG